MKLFVWEQAISLMYLGSLWPVIVYDIMYPTKCGNSIFGISIFVLSSHTVPKSKEESGSEHFYLCPLLILVFL